MEIRSSTVLITGGASGIGLALAVRFHTAGSRVVLCGRREAALADARARMPGAITRAGDLSRADERRALAAWVVRECPDVNVLVNNAGIQRYPKLDAGEGEWDRIEEEIAINLEAPVHLAMLLAPHLATRPDPAIVNITSGLAYVPFTRAPIYSATKAAMRSFTLSLRRHLADTPVRVIEIAPPAVDTDLGGPGLHSFGVKVDEFADAIFPRLAAGDLEIAYGFAEEARRAGPEQLQAIFLRMNR